MVVSQVGYCVPVLVDWVTLPGCDVIGCVRVGWGQVEVVVMSVVFLLVGRVYRWLT